MSSGQGEGDAQVLRNVRATRDAYVAARDLHVTNYHFTSGERPASATADVGGRLVVGDLPQQPPGFQPRTDLLAELDAVGPGVSVVHAVTGMRGVGKTQLAAAYARAKLAEGWRLIAWVNAEDAGSLEAGLSAIAEAAGLHGASGGDPGPVVRHWLETDGDRRLVVFDNAIDADAVRPNVPAGGASRVLITSNRQSVANLGTKVGVEVFAAGEALAFLEDRTALADPSGAEAVAAELGYLPLALAQAAAVIAGQHLTYGTYLERLRSLPAAEYLTREPGQPYPHGVAETVLLSLQATVADDHGGLCATIMELMSVLSAAGVRRDLMYGAAEAGLLGSAGAAPQTVDNALGKLAERSMLSFTVDGQAVIAHRLVLRIIRDQLAGQTRLAAVCRAAASILEARAQALAGSPNRSAVRDFPEQTGALRNAVSQCTSNPDPELAGALLSLRGWALFYLTALGDSSQQAILVGEPLIADQQHVLGPDHRDTLASQNELAKSYWIAGRISEAVELHTRTLDSRERVLGHDHPDTLASRNNLAIVYGAAGRMTEAIALLEPTLAARRELRGPDHPDTLTSQNGLANAYRAVGRTAEAVSLYEQTVAGFERVLGNDHPDTLTSRNNLALARLEAGHAAEAIALLQQVLLDRERVLGPGHPDISQSRTNLAGAYREVGRADEAITLFEQVLADLRRLFGDNHPNSVNPRNDLAVLYSETGRTDEAIVLLEQNLTVCQQILGPDNAYTLGSRINIGVAYRAAGRTHEAITLLEQALADCERGLGTDHPFTLDARTSLADAYRSAGQAD